MKGSSPLPVWLQREVCDVGWQRLETRLASVLLGGAITLADELGLRYKVLSIPTLVVVCRPTTGSAVSTSAAGVIDNVRNAGGDHPQSAFPFRRRQSLEPLLLLRVQRLHEIALLLLGCPRRAAVAALLV